MHLLIRTPFQKRCSLLVLKEVDCFFNVGVLAEARAPIFNRRFRQQSYPKASRNGNREWHSGVMVLHDFGLGRFLRGTCAKPPWSCNHTHNSDCWNAISKPVLRSHPSLLHEMQQQSQHPRTQQPPQHSHTDRHRPIATAARKNRVTNRLQEHR